MTFLINREMQEIINGIKVKSRAGMHKKSDHFFVSHFAVDKCRNEKKFKYFTRVFFFHVRPSYC
jgi:hypothetical protein